MSKILSREMAFIKDRQSARAQYKRWITCCSRTNWSLTSIKQIIRKPFQGALDLLGVSRSNTDTVVIGYQNFALSPPCTVPCGTVAPSHRIPSPFDLLTFSLLLTLRYFILSSSRLVWSVLTEWITSNYDSSSSFFPSSLDALLPNSGTATNSLPYDSTWSEISKNY